MVILAVVIGISCFSSALGMILERKKWRDELERAGFGARRNSYGKVVFVKNYAIDSVRQELVKLFEKRVKHLEEEIRVNLDHKSVALTEARIRLLEFRLALSTIAFDFPS